MVSSPSRPEAKSCAHKPDWVSGQNTHGAAGEPLEDCRSPTGPLLPWDWAWMSTGGHTLVASCPSQVSHAPEGTFLLYPSSRASLSPHTSFVCLTAWLAKEGTSQPGPASQKHQLLAKWGSLNPRDGRVFAWRSPIRVGVPVLRLRPWLL